MSPTWRFLFSCCHLGLSCKVGTYSLSQRLQQWLASNCACRHLFRLNLSFSLTTSGGIFVEGRKFRKWLGVNGSLSPGREEFGFSGLVFAIRSASVNKVLTTSSFIGSLPRIAFKLLFTVRTSQSAPGGGGGGGGGVEKPTCNLSA